MKKKLLSLALALALCLGLTVPAFAETYTETIDGITITINSDNATLTYTGSGKLTEEHAGYGAEYLLSMKGIDTYDTAGGILDTVSVNIGSGITADAQVLELMKEIFFDFGVKYVNIDHGNYSTAAERPVGGFTDVKESDYFADPVVWAVGKKITAGTSDTTFSPNQNCTVAQILSFLWRAYGSPKTSVNNPFSDVKSSDYYYSAALWAYEKGMITSSTFGGNNPCTRSMAVNYMWKADTAAVAAADFTIKDGVLIGYSGIGGDVVIPDGVTGIKIEAFDWRENLRSVVIPEGVTWLDNGAFYECENLTSVTIPASLEKIGGEVEVFANCPNITDVYYGGSEAQWKSFGGLIIDNNATPTMHYNSKMPGQPSVNTGFTDVPASADYAEAVKWAVDNGVTSGTSATTFSPDSVCTRGQIVTFLHRALAK